MTTPITDSTTPLMAELEMDTTSPIVTPTIIVSEQAFDINALRKQIHSNNSGATSIFIGSVRDVYDVEKEHLSLESMTLEHYPGMTERCLKKIALKAISKWNIHRVCIYHRIGTLSLGDDIVCVIATSQHRSDSLHAIQYIMDYLKTDAPFWKLERTIDNTNGTHSDTWVEQKQSDLDKTQ